MQEPLDLVRHLPLTEENYVIAYRTLIDRYQNDRILATYYWNAIANAPKCRPDSTHSMRDLLNSFTENTTALQKFPQVDLWNFTMLNWLLQKTDDSTRKRFELKFAQEDFPLYEDLFTFLTNQCRALETHALSTPATSSFKQQPSHSNKGKVNWRTEDRRSPHVMMVSTTRESLNAAQFIYCSHCRSKSHTLQRCTAFLGLSPHNRFTFVKSANLCTNCLSSVHSFSSCRSTSTCRHCSSKHHTLLHFFKENDDRISNKEVQTPNESSATSSSNTHSSPPLAMSTIGEALGTPQSILLATVRFQVRDKWGNYQSVRALCDSGSQTSFMTERCRKRLALDLIPSSSSITGVGHSAISSAHGYVNCSIRPDGSSTNLGLAAMVLPSICSELPTSPLSNIHCFENLKLADPLWHSPGPVDMLLGAEVFSRIVKEGVISGDGTRPAAMNTIFGWILLGPTSSSTTHKVHSFFVSTESCLNDTLREFWKLEDIPNRSILSPEDKQVEDHFTNTHYRAPSGRFGVCLPFKESKSSPPSFPGSLKMADRRLLALERRLSKQPSVRDLYHNFMRDYLDAGHMTKLSTPLPPDNCYFIPHHCVLKTEGSTAKIRVVFDASANAENGTSLNACLLTGSKLQSDISVILLRFRLYNYVFTCDIRQMYRQILVSPPHRVFQMIRWRFSPQDPVETYSLNTVTYGVSSSPYLAIRCLLQLAKQGQNQFPLASSAINNRLYVDDLALGADDIASAIKLRDELVQLLSSGGFELRKWASNHAAVLDGIPEDHRQTSSSNFDPDAEMICKIRGLQWQSNPDVFTFHVNAVHTQCSKRSILSEVTRIYDHLGFLSPLTFFAKHLIQRLWSLALGWDELPPPEICSQWQNYKASLSQLSHVKINRCLRPQSFVECQLHAFCDASWRHVRSADNPADPASRGLSQELLLSCSLWWAGPPWLKEPPSMWPDDFLVSAISADSLPEGKVVSLLAEEALDEADLEDLEAQLYCQVYHTNPVENEDLSALETVKENNTPSNNITTATTANKRYFKSFSNCSPAKEKPNQVNSNRMITSSANGNPNTSTSTTTISTTNVPVHNVSTVEVNSQVKHKKRKKKSGQDNDSKYEQILSSLLKLRGPLQNASQDVNLSSHLRNEFNNSFNNVYDQMKKTYPNKSARDKKLKNWNFLVTKLTRKLSPKFIAVIKAKAEKRAQKLARKLNKSTEKGNKSTEKGNKSTEKENKSTEKENKSTEKEPEPVAEVICLSDSDDDNDSVIEIPRHFPLVCVSDSESEETTSLTTTDNGTESTFVSSNVVIKQEINDTADADSTSSSTITSTSTKTTPDNANTDGQHEVNEEQEHDNDDVIIVENPNRNEVIDLDSDASDNEETHDQNISETPMFDDNTQSYDSVNGPDKGNTTQESFEDFNATTEGTSYEFLNSCNASAQSSPDSHDPVPSGNRTEFARPANPCEVYESGGSSTTSECVPRILKPVVFNEEEFPQDDMFSEENLEKFKHLISTPKQTKAKSGKHARETLKNAADDDNEEGKESDDEELNESSNKSFKKLPNLSSIDKSSGSDKKKNRKNLKEDDSETTAPAGSKKSKKKRTTSERSTEVIVEADTTATDQVIFESKKTKKRKNTELDVDITEPNLQKKKSKKKRKQSGCESNQDEQDTTEMDTTCNDTSLFDLTAEFQNSDFVIVDEFNAENNESELDQLNTSNLKDSVTCSGDNLIESCSDDEAAVEVHSTTNETETSTTFLVQGSSNDIGKHPESHTHKNSQKELVSDLTINVTSSTKNKKSRFENHWSPNKDIFNSTIVNVKDFDVDKICGKLSSDPQLWEIVHLDAINYRSVRGTGVRCRKCREYGHAAVRCHNKAGPIVCSMCAAVGHSSAWCPNKLCNWCGDSVPSSISVCRKCIRFKHHICRVCQMKGHSEDYCPDLWRRYHLTTEVGPLKKPSGTFKHPRKSCCICANIGHTEDSCRKALGYKISANVHLYDNVYNNQDASRVIVADNLQNVGNVNDIRAPIPQQVWEMQNRNNRLGESNPNNRQIMNVPFQHYIPQTSNSQAILPVYNFPQQFSPMQQFNIPLSPSKFQTDFPVPQREMYDFITTRPLHVVQNFLKEKLNRLSSFNCDPAFLEGFITCLENMPNPKPDQLSLAYMHLNMLVFGIYNYANARKHLDHLRQFQQIPSHHRLKKCKRTELWNSYSYIFGTIKHTPRSTLYLRQIILNNTR